ncbi:putative 2-(5''-triphosphoribosyl)-3'-dephosphocoenzyme-A synthase [Clarias magur]|uniref:Putative 2-(5''-triphosphoribosyl)-3'-dephosphocoenzyme-A synthase n=1 Tax=Clarias magur TaxID=1594786 RepID=A0A8J4U3K6_CLAMG|nr:putative 2-(5''-triphosphoribosyl)-3'-dephosphocoenzyme-A synthase [Clarias magur]
MVEVKGGKVAHPSCMTQTQMQVSTSRTASQECSCFSGGEIGLAQCESGCRSVLDYGGALKRKYRKPSSSNVNND